MALAVPHHRFTVEDFYRMAEAGILSEDDRVELIGGEIVEMTPIGSRHAGCVAWLAAAFSRFQEQCTVWIQSPIRAGSQSELQPDLALLKPRLDFYRKGHPQPGDILLIVEVADTSQEYDRGTKVPLYARYGIPEVWLVDLESEIIEIHRIPGGDNYQDTRVVKRGDLVSCQGLPELQLAVNDILG